jgi:hypothetical protein
VPPLLYGIWRSRAGGRWRAGLMAFLAAGVPLAALGWYHHRLHGGPPWLFPVALYGESMLRPGLTPSVLAQGCAYTALHMLRLFGWTLPLLPALAWLGRGERNPRNLLLWLSISGLVTIYFFYPSAGGPQLGPRYYFGLLGPLAILAGVTIERLWQSRRGRAFFVALLAASLGVYALRAIREHERSARFNAPFRLAADAELENAVVFMRNVSRGDGARNPPGWRSPVLFVPDLGVRNHRLLALYPGRGVYGYSWSSEGPRLQRGMPGGSPAAPD